MRTVSRPQQIPIGPFLAGLLALALATGGLFGETATWAIITLYVSIILRLVLRALKWPLPPQPVKLAALAFGTALVIANYGSVLGLEAGLGVLVVLVALKLLETSSIRDFQVLVLLGYFVVLCDLFFVQDLEHWLYFGLILAALTVALIRVHGESGLFRAIRMSASLVVPALPIIVLLYLAFPRWSGGFRLRVAGEIQGADSMSDHMEPGAVATFSLRHEQAFYATFPDGNVPPQAEMYWRGRVLWRGDGLTWVAGPNLNPEHRQFHGFGGAPIVQNIVLQPHGWLVALDYPDCAAAFVPDSVYEAGNSLRRTKGGLLPEAYSITSYPEDLNRLLEWDQDEVTLRKPDYVSPAVKKLVDSWRAGNADDRRIVQRAMAFFGSGAFKYSLSPGLYLNNGHALDEFLFHRRLGFCEHYAGAFATLMRVAGIHSRVVLGYHGGDFNGTLVKVNESDAHSWCEVWLKGQGWKRMDPTSVIAPEVINDGMQSYLAHAGTAADATAQGGSLSFWRRWTDGGRLVWDNLSYHWDLYILSYGEDEQRSFLGRLGLTGHSWNQVLTALAGMILLILGGVALWLMRPGRVRRDPEVRCFDRFCRIMADAGVIREVWEGPLDFSARAADRFPAEAEKIRVVGNLYAKLRYGRHTAPVSELWRAVREVARLLARRSRGG